MNVFAWTGIAIATVVIGIFVIVWLVNMVRHPIGQVILFGWCLIGLIAWAVTGGAWLLWKHGV